MKIALAQMEVVAGNPDKNVKTMLDMIKEAKEKGVDLITFPEMAIGGYLLGDKWENESYCKNLMEYNEDIRKASTGIAVAYGNVFVDDKINERVGDTAIHPNEDGRTRKYNALYVFEDGKPAKRVLETPLLPEGIQPKTLLPTYRIFDDKRYFYSTLDIARDFGKTLEELVQPFALKKGRVGFEICEDLWCEDYRKNGKALNPTKLLIENGAEIVINASASPWTYGKNGARDRRVAFLKRESGERFVPFFYVNCTGVQNNGKNFVTFDGGSTVYNAQGEPIRFSTTAYTPELLIIEEEDLKKPSIPRKEKEMIAQKYEAVVRGLRGMKDAIGTEKDLGFVIGLSGGIDSAVSASLLVAVFGKENVLGVNMPSQYNSDKTKNAAEYVAKALDIDYAIAPIDELVEVNRKIVDAVDPMENGKILSQFNMENLQAKIRGTSLLSNIAAKYGRFFTNNGNKLEVALGYATLYGDWGGAIAPLGDLTKAEIVAMARYINNEVYQKEVIPGALLPDKLWRFEKDQIEPSAELKEKQVDPMKFLYHCALVSGMTDYSAKGAEDFMQWYLEGTLHTRIDRYLQGTVEGNETIGFPLMKRWGVDSPKNFLEDIEWLDRNVLGAVYKRVQSPPIIITSKSAYGYDRRESILPYLPSRKQGRLKEQILKLKTYVPIEQ